MLSKTDYRWNKVNEGLFADKNAKRRKLEFVRPLKTSNGFQILEQMGRAKGKKADFTDADAIDSSSSNVIKISIENGDENGKKSALTRKESGLFPYSLVVTNHRWQRLSRAGPGFFNHGNTCFLNSTLQCLLHTPSLVQILRNHGKQALKGITDSPMRGGNDNFQHRHQSSIIEYFQRLVIDFWSNQNGRSLSPRAMVQNIRRVGRQFRPSRQEDAHEYLRQLLDCMHEEILKANKIKVSDGSIAESTFLSRIFGGYLCNELKCDVCKYCSRTFNHFQDLSLEVTGGISSIQDALRAFLKPERLGSGNEWLCGGCDKKVKATKQMKINETPSVLVLHLKRFSFGASFGKINKPIKFHEKIEVSSEIEKESSKYSLFGLIVHHGNSVHSGHYVAYVKAANGQWHEMNDSTVALTSIGRVLSQQAYILFYAKDIQTPSEDKNQNDPKANTDTINNSLMTEKSNLKASDGAIPNKKNTVDMQLNVKRKDKHNSESGGSDDSDAAIDSKSNLSWKESEMVQVYGTTKPCRLKRLRSWTLKPVLFLGQVKRRFGSWKIPKNLENIRELVRGKCSNVQTTEENKRNIDSNDEDFGKEKNTIDVVSHEDSYLDTPYYPVVRPKKREIDVSDKKKETEEDISLMLIKDAKRARTGGQEGMWDSVAENVVAAIKKQTMEQRKQEKKLLDGRKVGDWDANLDAGRVKKVKTKPSHDNEDSWDQVDNPFQNVQDRRVEDGVAPMMFDDAIGGKKDRSRDGIKKGKNNKFGYSNSKKKS